MNGKIFGNSLVKSGFVAFALALGLVACGGDNGVDGKDGVSGSDDMDGTSCELKIAKDASYYEITCGDKTISVPLNGNSGQNVGTNTGVGVNPDDAYLTFDRRVYVGNNSAAKITMKNEALKGDSVVVKFCAGECKNIALRKGNGVFTRTIYLNGTGNQKDNFTVVENGKVKVNYANLDVNLADSATWILKAQGYVQFGQDVYTTPVTQPSVYLYDDDNLSDFAYVTVSSSKNKAGIKVKLNRYSDYFYGTFEMSVAGGGSKVLEIENGNKIGVAYYDSSMAVTQTDSATINFPENTYNATLSFGDTWYNGYEDKAVINLTDYFLTTQVPAKVSVWSDSDVDGCEVDLFPTSGGLVGYMRIGYVEFVSRKTDKACALVVSAGDNIYAEYESAYGNKTVKASATWGSRSTKDNWVYLNPNIVYGSFVDHRDGLVYKTVKIGTQTWMAENLNYAYTGVKYNYRGKAIDSTSWCYDNNPSNCEIYGRLYTWSSVMDSAAQFPVNAGTNCGFGKTCTPKSPHRGICPQGWHVPTNEEFNTLLSYVGGSNSANLLLKTTSGWLNGSNGSDKYGFSALPAGINLYSGFYGEGDNSGFWSVSESGNDNAFNLTMVEGFTGLGDCGDNVYGYCKPRAYSVRCVLDSSDLNENTTTLSSSSSVPGSSSSVIPSEVEGSSSSVASSSSAKSSSSVASSSSEKSSSSVASSSSAKSSSSSVISGSSSSVIPSEVEGSSSSSRTNWAYLNPAKTYGTMTDTRDGQVYKTVTIGTQTWMAENLNYEYNKGTAKSFCYKDETSNCTMYGRLYLWSAAMDSAAVFSTSGKDCGNGKTCSPTGTIRGVCPEGWHLPSKDEWNALFTAVGGSSTAGVKLKSVEGWKYYSASTTGTDVYGFSALPAGYGFIVGGFRDVSNYAHFWSSTEYSSNFAYYMHLSYGNENAYLDYYSKYGARSVRCLKDSF